LNILGVFMSPGRRKNLLGESSATVHTCAEKKIFVKGKGTSKEKIKKGTNKILIIDDEEDTVMMVKMYLEHHRYEIITAGDGQEGLEKAKTEKPDLIVLDLMLPKIDGYKVCGLLKKDSRYAKIPVIMFTAKAQEKDIKLGQEVGADAYITKPLEPEVLLLKIEELIGK